METEVGWRTDVVNRCPEFAFKLAFLLHSLLAPRLPLVLVLRHARRPTSHDSSAAAKRIRLAGMVSGIALSSPLYCTVCVFVRSRQSYTIKGTVLQNALYTMVIF